MLEALASQNHGESPSFPVVSSLPVRHSSDPPEADRLWNLNWKSVTLLIENLTTFQKIRIVFPIFQLIYSVVPSKAVSISKYNSISPAKC